VTGYFGLEFSKRLNAWRACVYLGTKRNDAGYYREKIDAAISYNHLCLKLHGEFAVLNDIPGWQNIHPEPIKRPKIYKNTKGYTFHKDMQKWMAYIRREGKTIHLGYYSTEAEAQQAHLDARLNIIPS